MNFFDNRGTFSILPFLTPLTDIASATQKPTTP
jgi:hypothetical protein